MDQLPSFDALLPPAMARKAEEVGVTKAALPLMSTFALAVLAGAFVGFGAMLSTVTLAGAEGMPYGFGRLLAGLTFSLGLILVVVAGAELFTGNTLLVMAAASRRIKLRSVIRNWGIAYVGNFVGAVATAAMVYLSGHFRAGGGAVGKRALDIAAAKAGLGFDEALWLGVLANALVCLAVWLTLSARSVVDKVVAIVGPITAFVAAGFEHSIANMYFLPMGLFIRSGGDGKFWDAVGSTASEYSGLTWKAFLIDNLVPVTIGNIIGGAVLVGAVYWFVYLRGSGPGRQAAN
ncbi:MAG TPA: formate/nitrite family transporter [Acidimicrobiia bacterium]|nr:formate/nitrite family transporter [Acidimicrobiia bacterium]